MLSATHAALTILFITFAAAAVQPPNIVIILADDLGYGDVSCYGATKIRTPNVDRLAAQGLRFTDAHAAAATCTPSRYALLTGEYAWRKKGTGILPGDANLIIDPARTTLPAILQRAGYVTGAVGKWHLGLGSAKIDWNREIKPGPREIGFNYSFIMPATGDRVPCVYVENQRVVGLDPADPLTVSFQEKIGSEPTGKDNPDALKVHPSHGHDMTIVNGISRIGYMAGGRNARWSDEDMADTLTRKAVQFLEQNQSTNFFLYFATHDIHVPRVPHPRFAGKTDLGPRGDVIVQFDWSTGEILNALDRLHLATNTLLILTSDNGPVIDDGYQDQAREKLDGHRPAGPLRGGKYSAFEGGTRVPFIVRWPGHIKPGTSDALICQVDFLASFAHLTNQKLNPGDGPDSFDILDAVLGSAGQGRDHLVEQAASLSLRKQLQKYIEPNQNARAAATKTESGNNREPQLYRLNDDPAETRNLAPESPALVEDLDRQLQKIRRDGRSRKVP
jgi:arylsulfatase A-like enzyme